MMRPSLDVVSSLSLLAALVLLVAAALACAAAPEAAVVDARRVNLSRVLHIPAALRGSVPEVVGASDSPSRARAATALRAWAENHLSCVLAHEDTTPTPKGAEGKPAASAGGDCPAAAAKCDANSVRAWNILGCVVPHAGFAHILGAEYNKRTCLTEALRCDRHYAFAWYNLGVVLDQRLRETFSFFGESFNKRDCFRRAIADAAGAATSEMWYNLGLSLADGEKVDVQLQQHRGGGGGNGAVDKRACYIEALRRDPSNAFAWNNLGNVLGDHETVSIELSGGGSGVGDARCARDVGASRRSDGAGGAAPTAPTASLTTAFVADKRACYERVLCLAPSLAITWYNLGGSLASANDTATVGGESYRKADCIVEAFLRTAALPDGHPGREVLRGSARVWINLAGAMASADDVVIIDGKRHSVVDCYRRALTIDPDISASAWNNLGSALALTVAARSNGESGEEPTVIIRGEPYTARDCYVQALRRDATNAAAWVNLGDAMATSNNSAASTAVVVVFPPSSANNNDGASSSTSFTRLRCYVEALKLDPTDSYAWNMLGSVLHHSAGGGGKRWVSVRVGDAGRFSARDAFARAVTVAPSNYRAWYNLGVEMNRVDSVDVGGVTLTSRQCLVRALGGGYCAAWNALGNLLDASASESPATQQQQQQRGDGGSSTAVSIGGFLYTRKRCYVEAVLCDEKHSTAWHNLGVSLSDANDKIAVGRHGGAMTQKLIFVRAVEADPTNADAWYNLGLVMTHPERATVAGASVDRAVCFEKYDVLTKQREEQRHQP